VSLFGIRGGPQEGVELASTSHVLAVAAQAGARKVTHDPAENVSGFIVDAPTVPHAFALAGEIFKPLYGSNWWAEVSTFPHFN
jgi:hypothetical protein